MIVVGTAVVNASTDKVELVAPLGFGTARGVRLSNFTGDSLTLTNISGTEQSQEYLAPQTQMVYATANIGATPTVIGQVYPPSQVADNLLVEWSTDPDNDFIGTYPAALPSAITNTNGAASVEAESGADSLVLQGLRIPGPQALLVGHATATWTAEPLDFLEVIYFEAVESGPSAGDLGGANVNVLTSFGPFVAGSGTHTISFCIPISLTHSGPLTIAMQPLAPASLALSNITYAVYSLSNTQTDIPTTYLDIFGTITATATVTPAVGSATLNQIPLDCAVSPGILAADPRREYHASLLETTSGPGKSTDGFVTGVGDILPTPLGAAGTNGVNPPIITTYDNRLYMGGPAHDLIVSHNEIPASLLTSTTQQLVFNYMASSDVGNITLSLGLNTIGPVYSYVSYH